MQRHQAEILVGLCLPGTVQGVTEIQHSADVAGRHFRTLEHPAALRGHVLVLREWPLDLAGAELPLVVLTQVVLLRPARILRGVLVGRLAVLQIHVLAVSRLVLVFEAVQSVEDDPVAARRRLALVEGHVVIGAVVVISALLVRQQIAAGDLRPTIQVPAVVREAAQVVVELGALAVDAGVRVEFVILQLLLLRALHLHVIILRPAGTVIVTRRSVARRRAGVILPLALAAGAEARAPRALDLKALATLVRGRRMAGPAALDAIASGVSVA